MKGYFLEPEKMGIQEFFMIKTENGSENYNFAVSISKFFL